MYKILIVEDEYYERNELKKQIEMEFKDDRIFTAGTCNEAIGLIKTEVPDLILLDIMLSNNSGFEVADFIKREYPNIQIIIITAYNEFDFAHRALSMGIGDYLLKPVRPEILSKRIKKLLYEDKENRRSSNSQKSPYAWPYIKSSNLDGLKRIIDFHPNTIAVFSLKDEKDIKTREIIVNEINQSIRNIGWMEHKEDWIILYLLLSSKINSKLYFSKLIQKYPKIRIGVSHRFSDMDNIVFAYNEGFLAYKSGMFFPNYKVILAEDYENVIEPPGEYPFDIEMALLNSIKRGDTHRQRLKVKEITNYFINNCGKDYLVLEKWVKSLFFYINRYCQQVSGNDNTFGEFQFTTEVELYRCIENMVDNAAGTIMINKKVENPLIKEALNIIHNKFHEDISLKSVADKLFINHIYLSRLFKEEVGEGFKDYLIRIRMEAAAEILMDSTVSITQVANSVGYNDINYFSKSFKKFYGVSPTEYY